MIRNDQMAKQSRMERRMRSREGPGLSVLAVLLSVILWKKDGGNCGGKRRAELNYIRCQLCYWGKIMVLQGSLRRLLPRWDQAIDNTFFFHRRH